MGEFPVRVGILGGGQLAKMLAESARSLGAIPLILASKEDDCALSVVHPINTYIGWNKKNLKSLAQSVDCLIIENEFLDLNLLRSCMGKTPVYPSLKCLGQVQSKLNQKLTLRRVGLGTMDFFEVHCWADVVRAYKKFDGLAVYKTAHFGYDGKGTVFLDKSILQKDTLGVWNGYVERRADFKREVAVIVARDIRGESVCFPPVETFQKNGICRWVKAPLNVADSILIDAESLAKKVIQGFDGVGVFGIEMFLLRDDGLVVNEVAPRVHNSGHITMNASPVSQFEMHLRAVLGLGLLEAKFIKPAAMVNILGRSKKRLSKVKMKPWKSKKKEGAWVYWYGKSGVTLNRKLGHINVCSVSSERALRLALDLRDKLSI